MRIRTVVLASLLAASSTAAFAKGDSKPAPAKTAKKAPPAPRKKLVPPPNAEHKKALADLYGGFKFGMSKDEVLGVLQKQIDERYDDKLKATSDISAQDRLRKDRKEELARASSTYVAFDGKKTGWDVSIVENEFAHGTGESMMERWENQAGKNQRRFFFFRDGKLYKMFVSLDVSILPEDKKNFDTFKAVMEGKYGPGDIEEGKITWRTNEFDVRAVDHLKTYDAIALAIEDPKVVKELEPLRDAKRAPKAETSSVIKAVIDPEGKDHPDVKSNGGAVDAVIKAQGGSGGTKK
ncbi:MAG: hypothetical protein JWO36_2586 [Myxococcales bacterium]|nr:hypothetical protein [Myxococcales bacterium]